MLYSEFIAGTGCKENGHNYQIYKELEIIYMNTDCTKDHIYEMGKKLVDNSKTPEQIELEKKIIEEIEILKGEIESLLKDKKTYETARKTETDPTWLRHWKESEARVKENIRILKARISGLRWVLRG